MDVRKGFNLESAELFIFAPVDPYLNLYANIPVTESGTELEEAYFVTSSLPAGLQVKGGKFKSGFGRINGQHPHAWDFADAPLNYRAFMGAEGMGGEKGVQLTWLPDLPIYLQLGIEALQGENDQLFGADAKDGPHAFTVFAKARWISGKAARSCSAPPSPREKRKSRRWPTTRRSPGTPISSALKWSTSGSRKEVRRLTLQSEYLYRKQTGDLRTGDPADPASTLESLKRAQDGIYVQGLYQIDRWRIGARYDVLDLFKKDYILSGTQQDMGNSPGGRPEPWSSTPRNSPGSASSTPATNPRATGRPTTKCIFQMLLGIGAHAAHSF